MNFKIMTNRLSSIRLIAVAGVLFLLSAVTGCGERQSRKLTTHLEETGIAQDCRELFMEGRTCQRELRYAEAISIYSRCAMFTSDDETECWQLQPIVLDALLQLMNSYQSMGSPDSCVAHLQRIIDRPTSLLARYCQRDLYSLLGYALSRTEAMDKAEESMRRALSLPLFQPSHERLYRDYAYAAAIYFGNPAYQEEVIQWCRMAINESKLCLRQPGVQWVTSMLGTLYKRTGRIDEAIKLLSASIEEASQEGDALGEANACNFLCELYLYWNMPNYAKIYADRALQVLENRAGLNRMIETATLLLKGRALQESSQADSAIYYWRRAESCCEQLPYNSGQVDVDYYWGTFLSGSQNEQEYHIGMERLRMVTLQGTLSVKAKAYFSMAKGYLAHGEDKLGEAMLDSMFYQLHLSPHPLYVENAYPFALQHFVAKGNTSQIVRYAQALVEEKGDYAEQLLSRKLAESIVKIQVEKKEQELMTAKEKLNNQRIYIVLMSCIALLIAVIASIGYRLYVTRKKSMERELIGLKDNLSDVQKHNLEIKSQLTNLLSDISERSQLEAATPQLLREKGEQRFRQRFEQFYPTFLYKLRDRVPAITRSEELLCMLMALGQDTHQIEHLLGIAHRSVIMARHRLRKKIDLPEEMSLEQFVQSLVDVDMEKAE